METNSEKLQALLTTLSVNDLSVIFNAYSQWFNDSSFDADLNPCPKIYPMDQIIDVLAEYRCDGTIGDLLDRFDIHDPCFVVYESEIVSYKNVLFAVANILKYPDHLIEFLMDEDLHTLTFYEIPQRLQEIVKEYNFTK